MIGVTKRPIDLTLLLTFFPFLLSFAIGFAPSQGVSKDEEFHPKARSSGLDNEKDIADALYQIAKVLRNNQEQSNLYERMALLEASFSLSQEQNTRMKNRIQELEKNIPDINSKLEISSRILAKAEALEISTKTMIEAFEEKLSTLAAEILRLKSVAVTVEDSLAPSSGRLSKAIEKDPREVGKGTNQGDYVKLNILQADNNETINAKDKREAMKRLCFPAISSTEASGCVFTYEGKLADWTSANQLCKIEAGVLASYAHVKLLNLTREGEIKIWLSKDSDNKFNDDLEIPSRGSKKPNGISNQNDFITEHLDDKGEDGSRLVDAGAGSTNGSLGIIDIRNLPNLEVKDQNIDKNVYVSNVRSTDHDDLHHLDSFVANFEDEVLERAVVKRSLKEFSSVNVPHDAIKFKEFLLLLSSENDQDLNPEAEMVMSDSTSGNDNVDLFSLLKGVPKVDQTTFSKEEKLCPLLICKNNGSCFVQMDSCTTVHKFWCIS